MKTIKKRLSKLDNELKESSWVKREKSLIKKHPYPWPINLPTGKIPIRERIAGMERVIDLYKNRWQTLYSPRLSLLKRRYAGLERCFVIGNGPSLNDTDLGKLKDEVSFGTNGIFLKFDQSDFRPTFYVVEDHLVAEDRAEQINALKGDFIKLFPIYLAYCIKEAPDTIFFNHRARTPPAFNFSTDASLQTYAGCTVTFTCLQLAFFLGVKEIYLIGVDFSYAVPNTANMEREYNVGIIDMAEDDNNHFNKDYFGKGYRWHEPQVEKMGQAYLEARNVTERHGCRIFNATKGGKLELFERVDYDSLF